MNPTDTTITKETLVWTKDGKSLGNAMHLYHRQEEINPQLQFYATYLETFSFETGERHYLPTDFLSPSEKGGLTISFTLAQVEHNTWNRKPAFIASGKAIREDLPAMLVHAPEPI